MLFHNIECQQLYKLMVTVTIYFHYIIAISEIVYLLRNCNEMHHNAYCETSQKICSALRTGSPLKPPVFCCTNMVTLV